MPLKPTDRFTTQTGLRITVQVPDTCADQILTAILPHDPLSYGDYDQVSFRTTPGRQTFRSTGQGRNAATEKSVSVPCCELSFFINENNVERVLKAIYASHPYEEPVIFVTQTTRSCHIRGLDEDNPNRFWNSAPSDWVPDAHR